jgi:2Fe-2S type ferredoxin
MSTEPAETAPPGNPSEQVFAVTLTVTGQTIHCRADQHVLDAAESVGLRLPCSCRQGKCGTCVTKVLSGRVEMHHNGGIRKRRIELGYVLICCSKPLTDLVIER